MSRGPGKPLLPRNRSVEAGLSQLSPHLSTSTPSSSTTTSISTSSSSSSTLGSNLGHSPLTFAQISRQQQQQMLQMQHQQQYLAQNANGNVSGHSAPMKTNLNPMMATGIPQQQQFLMNPMNNNNGQRSLAPAAPAPCLPSLQLPSAPPLPAASPLAPAQGAQAAPRSAQTTPRSSPRQSPLSGAKSTSSTQKRSTQQHDVNLPQFGNQVFSLEPEVIPDFIPSDPYSAPASLFGTGYGVGMFLNDHNLESPLAVPNPSPRTDSFLNLEGDAFYDPEVKEEPHHSEGSLEEWTTASFVMQEETNGGAGMFSHQHVQPQAPFDPLVKSEGLDEEEEDLDKQGGKKKSTNSAASARFRVKKKLKEQERELHAKAITAKVHALQRKALVLEAEAAYLREILRLRAINEAALNPASTLPKTRPMMRPISQPTTTTTPPAAEIGVTIDARDHRRT